MGRLGDAQAMAELQAHEVGSAGETTGLEIKLNRASVFDAGTGRALQTRRSEWSLSRSRARRTGRTPRRW
jgi:hypothetical protein